MDLRRGLVLVVPMVAGCVSDPAVDTVAQGVAVAGPWVPSASTRSIAASQHVPVVDPPAVSPLGRCTSTNAFACSCTHPACMTAYAGTRELNTYLLRRFSFLRAGGTYCCRQNSARTTVPMLSVHATGRAIDLMVPMTGGDADNTLGDAVAAWLVENAEYIGIQRVIWDRAFWNGERGFGLLSSASLPHTDHLHVELSVAGADRRTPFFTSGASTGTACAPRCDGTLLIAADCSSTDCAASGAPCVAGAPPRGGTPAPPEPPSAAVAGAAIPGVTAVAAPARLTFVGPARMFDTRTPSASTRLLRSGAAGPLSPASNGVLRDWSAAGLPAGSTGAWLNVAAVGAGAAGFVTVFTEGTARPPTSTVNYVDALANSNATPVAFGAGGGVVFEALNPADVIVDAYAAFSPTGTGLVPAGPLRALDTRSDVALSPGTPRAVDVGAPAGAVGVVASVIALSGAAPGFLTAFPCGTDIPPTSNVNFGAGATVANTVVSRLGGGQLCLASNVSTHAIVDVTGFLMPTGGLTYTALSPQRLLDTRQPTSLYSGRLAARQVLELPVQRMPGMPASAVAVVANLTAVSASEPGFVTAFPCGTPVPGTSSLNFPADTAVGAVSVSTLGSGSLCVFSNVRTHLIVDVLGVWTGAATPVTPAPPIDDGDDVPPEGMDAGTMTPVVDAGRPVVDAGGMARDTGAATRDAGAVATDVGAAVDRPTTVADAGATTDAPTGGDAPVATADAGETAGGGPVAGGCGCRADAGGPSARASWVAALAGLVGLMRRRRRARP